MVDIFASIGEALQNLVAPVEKGIVETTTGAIVPLALGAGGLYVLTTDKKNSILGIALLAGAGLLAGGTSLFGMTGVASSSDSIARSVAQPTDSVYYAAKPSNPILDAILRGPLLPATPTPVSDWFWYGPLLQPYRTTTPSAPEPTTITGPSVIDFFLTGPLFSWLKW